MESELKTLGQRIKGIRGTTFQVDFGKQLGVTQGTVSAWERDDRGRPPSAEILFRLAMLASDPDDHAFFLQRAGLSREVIVSAANKIAGDQVVHPQPGDNVLVKSLWGDTPALELPADLVPAPVSTRYFVIDERCEGYGFRKGDILLLDVSQNCPPDLTPFWGKKVLVEYQLVRVPTEYIIGTLLFREGRRHETHILYDALIVPWKDVDDDLGEKPHPFLETNRGHRMKWEAKEKGGLMVGGWWDHRARFEISDDSRARLGISSHEAIKATPDDLERARKEARLSGTYSIRGIVIGWFRPPSKGGK